MRTVVSTEPLQMDPSAASSHAAVRTDQEEPKAGKKKEDVKCDEGGECVLPESLVRVLTDPDVLLVGVGVGGDVCRLEKEYEQLRACGGVQGVVDLSELAKRKVSVCFELLNCSLFCGEVCQNTGNPLTP